jgi:hypothetical protein
MSTARQVLHQWVVYENPRDYPGKFVVRRWLIGPGTITPVAAVEVTDTLDEARAAVPDGLFCTPRMPDDDPCIVEVWL